MPLNLYTWPPFIAALLNAGLAGGAIYLNARRPLNRTFALWNGAMAIWNVGTLVMYTAPDAASAWRWTVLFRDAMVFIHAFFFHFVLRLLDDTSPKNRLALQGAYLSAAVFLVFNHWGTHFVEGMVREYWGFIPRPGPWARIYALVFNAYILYSLYLLWKAVSTSFGYRRNQIQFVLAATVVVFGSALSNFLVILGASFYPFGNLFNIVYSLMVGYAVVTFGWIDLRSALRKITVSTALAGGLAAVYLVILESLKHMFLHVEGSPLTVLQVAAVPMTLAAAPALRSILNPVLAKISLGPSHNLPSVMEEFQQSVLSTLDLTELRVAVRRFFQRLFDVRYTVVYLEGQSATDSPDRTDLSLPTPVLEHLRHSEDPVLKDRILWRAEHRAHRAPPFEETAWSSFFSVAPFDLLVPLRWGDKMIGVLALGPKFNGDMFHPADLSIVRMLGNQLALALRNAANFKELQQNQSQLARQQDINAIGGLAAELAHELTKPLTHILNEEARLHQSSAPLEKGLKKISQNVQRATEILDGFVMLASNRPLLRIPVRLQDLIDESLEALGLPDESSIQIDRQWGHVAAVMVNPGQMVQVFTNLIQNAWQAMPEGGKLTLRIDPASGTDGEVVVSVEDTGEGIPSGLASKIFEPFFTTKPNRGCRGVGLTLSRAMVERHGGRLEVVSPAGQGRGTLARVRLPVHIPQEVSHA